MASKSLPNPPSLIEGGNRRFLVFEAPNDANLPLYIKQMKKFKVTHMVRACDSTYGEEPLAESGIEVHELSFPDGTAPPDSVIAEWLKLLHKIDLEAATAGEGEAEEEEKKSKSSKKSKAKKSKSADLVEKVESGVDEKVAPSQCIAIHCVAGLGRAPVLAAIAMIEGGMDPLDVIKEIRRKRPGALNMPQLRQITEYKRKGKRGPGCVIM